MYLHILRSGATEELFKIKLSPDHTFVNNCEISYFTLLMCLYHLQHNCLVNIINLR